MIEFKEYKVRIKYTDLVILIILFLMPFLIDYIWETNFKILGLIALYFILRGFYSFFTKQVKKIIFVNKETLVLIKYDFFKEKRIEVDLKTLNFSFKSIVVYPNKFYVLDFFIKNNKININRDYTLIGFSEEIVTSIIEVLERFSVKKMNTNEIY